MTIKDGGATILIILAIIAAVGFGASRIAKKEDSAIEEIAEDIIENHTGIDVDFTPGSDEAD